jgi:hypothetical protein
MSDLLEAIGRGWGWTGIVPAEIGAVSRFGHLIIRDVAGDFWYLDPELRTLERIGSTEAEVFAHMNKQEVREVWQALALVDAARERLGEPGEGQCYSLKTMALLRGDYGHDNLCIIPIAELIDFTGDFERQTHHLPPDSKIQLKVVD